MLVFPATRNVAVFFVWVRVCVLFASLVHLVFNPAFSKGLFTHAVKLSGEFTGWSAIGSWRAVSWRPCLRAQCSGTPSPSATWRGWPRSCSWALKFSGCNAGCASCHQWFRSPWETSGTHRHKYPEVVRKFIDASHEPEYLAYMMK